MSKPRFAPVAPFTATKAANDGMRAGTTTTTRKTTA